MIFIQQLGIEHITIKNTIEPYQTTMKTIDDPSYRGKVLNKTIQNIKILNQIHYHELIICHFMV